MRLKVTTSVNASHYSIIADVKVNGKKTTKVIENLGNLEQVKALAGNRNHEEWLRDYVQSLNDQENDENRVSVIRLNPSSKIKRNHKVTYNGGYLFLQDIYYDLGIHNICKQISDRYPKMTYDLNSILSRLIYSRIIYPNSKRATYAESRNFIEQPNFELQHIYRALSVLCKEDDFIQNQIYKNSLKISDRNTGVLYYDCTNYFFEIHESSGLKQYGISKQSRPKPLVGMGMFLDGDGIPLAFSIYPGNENEQPTLKPLEQKIIKDFGVSKMIVVTDAGLASNANRKFNDLSNRAFITVQSLKKLKPHVKKWALDPNGWRLPNSDDTTFFLEDLESTAEQIEIYKNKTFYKERWINENGLEQKMIVTYSLKHKYYHQKIRAGQVERAEDLIKTNPKKISKARQNDHKRFIKKLSITENGEVAQTEVYSIDNVLISNESQYDGFYGLCTNLNEGIETIIKVNNRRWEIEESFRIMKHEFQARPVELSRDDRIKAHFLTCFMSLIIYRYLEKKIGDKYTCSEIISALKKYNFIERIGDGYEPIYEASDITDALHKAFGFETDFEINPMKKMKKIFSMTKK